MSWCAGSEQFKGRRRGWVECTGSRPVSRAATYALLGSILLLVGAGALAADGGGIRPGGAEQSIAVNSGQPAQRQDIAALVDQSDVAAPRSNTWLLRVTGGDGWTARGEAGSIGPWPRSLRGHEILFRGGELDSLVGSSKHRRSSVASVLSEPVTAEPPRVVLART